MANELSFEVVEGRDKGKLIRIPDDGGSIGRKGAIAIDEKKSEDFHAQLECVNGGIVVRDLATAVGTFVNGKKVHEAPLNLNDVISIGSTKLALVHKAVQAEPNPVPQTSTPAGNEAIRLGLTSCPASSPSCCWVQAITVPKPRLKNSFISS